MMMCEQGCSPHTLPQDKIEMLPASMIGIVLYVCVCACLLLCVILTCQCRVLLLGKL